ncbi:hypothetical protein OH764_00835 [Burkholderia sp. M6-3]
MTEDHDRLMADAEAEKAEKCPLMHVERARQKLDRDDVRSGRRTHASMLKLNADGIRKNWVSSDADRGAIEASLSDCGRSLDGPQVGS